MTQKIFNVSNSTPLVVSLVYASWSTLFNYVHEKENSFFCFQQRWGKAEKQKFSYFFHSPNSPNYLLSFTRVYKNFPTNWNQDNNSNGAADYWLASKWRQLSDVKLGERNVWWGFVRKLTLPFVVVHFSFLPSVRDDESSFEICNDS